MTTTTAQLEAELYDAKAERAKVAEEMRSIHEAARGRALTAGQQDRWDRLEGQMEAATATIAAAQARLEEHAEETRAAVELAYSRGHFEAGSPGRPDGHTAPQVIRRGTTWDVETDLTTAHGQELRDRAQRVLDVVAERNLDPAAIERVSATIRRTNDEQSEPMARWLAAASNPAYERAFSKMVRDPDLGHTEFTPEERGAWQQTRTLARAMGIATDGSGGYQVPIVIDPAFLLRSTGSIDPMRELARVETIATDAWRGITTEGVTAYYRAEAAQMTDDAPSDLQQPTVQTMNGSAFVPVSWEYLDDVPGAMDEVGKLLADAADNLNAQVHATGNAVTQPQGFITACSGAGNQVAGSSGAAGAADLVAQDVYNTLEALPPRFRANAAWQASLQVMNDVRQLASSDTYHAFLVSLGQGWPAELLGKRILENSSCDTTVVSGSNDLVLWIGDWQQAHVLVDRVGSSIRVAPMLFGANSRPTGQSGIVMNFRHGSGTIVSNAVRVLVL